MTDYSKITALYSRLSVGDEDRDGGESNSIQNQKIFLENYARGQHLTNIRHYIDDDESGRFFDRSAYSRMMDDVENGKIGVCIMKDLMQGIGMTEKLALPTLIALCSIALGKPTLSSLAVLGEISIAGTMLKVDELANALQVCLDSGAKKVLLPITSAADLGLVPADLIGCFNLVFYQSAEDAVYKALGVE